LIFVCPSCVATNYCPDTLAGFTIVCRKCKTQITVPEPSGERPAWWRRHPYWAVVGLIELLAVAALAGAIVLLTVTPPPGDVPLLDAGSGGSSPRIAAPGGLVALEWRTDQESAGGYFTVTGQNITLEHTTQPQLDRVQVRDNPWPYVVFQDGQAPPPEPILLSLQMRLPNDESLSGERVTLRMVVNIEYPRPAQAAGPAGLQQATLRREWSFVVATEAQRASFARYLRQLAWLRGIAWACGVLVLLVGLAAVLFAQRQVSVMCPKCGRVTAATYFSGGRRISMSPCPHKS